MAAVEHAMKTCGSKANVASAMTRIASAVPVTTARLNTGAIKPTQLKSNAIGYMNKANGMVATNVSNAAAKIPTRGPVLPTRPGLGSLKARARTGAQNLKQNLKQGAKKAAKATGSIVSTGLEVVKDVGQRSAGLTAMGIGGKKK